MKTLFLISILSLLLSANDGAALYKKCAACHGANAEKKALGKSMVINTMSEDEVYGALKGYQDGTYGAGMKVLMKNQLAQLKDEDLKALSSYIPTLK